MTTNLKRWLQAVLVVVLFALSIWQNGVAGSLHNGKLAFPHAVISLLLIIPAAILIFHNIIGDLVFRRAVLVAFFTCFLWCSWQSMNHFVLGANVLKWDLLRAVGYGVLSVIYLHFEVKRNQANAEPYEQDSGAPPDAPSDTLSAERGFYYPD